MSRLLLVPMWSLLVLFVAEGSRARGDTFIVIAKNMDGSDVPPDEPVTLRVYNLEYDTFRVDGTIYQAEMSRAGEIPVTPRQIRDPNGALTFTFSVRPADLA